MEKNRSIEIITKLQTLKKQCKPTDNWEELLDYDEFYEKLFSKEGIDEVSKELDLFIDNLIIINDYTDKDEIIKVVKILVLRLNEISHKFSNMIETEEREALCDFIFSALDTIGFEYEGDITEEYREW